MDVGVKEMAAHLGVRPDTLRKWGRRYGLVRLRRRANGYRVYNAAAQSRLKTFVALLAGGLSPRSAGRRVRNLPAPPQKGNEALRRRGLAAARAFSLPALEAVYEKARVRHGTAGAFARVWEPVLTRLGERALRRKGSWTAAERFTGTFLRRRLSPLPFRRRGRRPTPRLAFAAPEGETHELWMLGADAAVSERGIGTLYLGPDLPIDSLARALRRTGVRHLCLTLTRRVRRRELRDLLGGLRRRLPGLRLYLSGRGSLSHANLIPTLGAVFLGTDFDTALIKLGRALKRYLPPSRKA